MLKTLARNVAPEPEAWIPIESLESLPELEELLNPRYLVDSGQSRAIRVDKDGKGYVYSGQQNLSPASELSSPSAKTHSRRKWMSKKRTLILKKRARIQRMIVLTLIAAIVVSVFAVAAKSDKGVALSSSPSTSYFVPTAVPVLVEGESKTLLTVASTLKEFQQEQNLEGMVAMSSFFDRASYSYKRSLPSLEFRYKKSGQINIDGEVKNFEGTQLTVGEVLDSYDVNVDSNDIVNPTRETLLNGVDAISITKVSTSTRVEDEAIPFTVEKINDATLTKGTTKIQRKGVNGTQQVTYTQNVDSNGSVISEVKSNVTVIKNPVNQIVHVGTKQPQYESGKASFYSTASGTCAHKTLPKGTIVTVTNTASGKSTTCRVADRGPFVKGRVIDLSKDVFSQIGSLSTGVISVTLSW